MANPTAAAGLIPAQRRPADPIPAAPRRTVIPVLPAPRVPAAETRRRAERARQALAAAIAAEGAYEMWRDLATAQVAAQVARNGGAR